MELKSVLAAASGSFLALAMTVHAQTAPSVGRPPQRRRSAR